MSKSRAPTSRRKIVTFRASTQIKYPKKPHERPRETRAVRAKFQGLESKRKRVTQRERQKEKQA